MANIIEGEYTTIGTGVTYEYVGAWELTKADVRWKVKIWQGTASAGEIDGSITGDITVDLKTLLIGHVHQYIETKFGAG